MYEDKTKKSALVMTRSRAIVKQKALFRTLIVRLHELAAFCKHFQVNNQNGNLIEDNGPDADSLSTMLMITLMLICYEQIVNLFDQDTVYYSYIQETMMIIMALPMIMMF